MIEWDPTACVQLEHAFDGIVSISQLSRQGSIASHHLGDKSRTALPWKMSRIGDSRVALVARARKRGSSQRWRQERSSR